MAPLLSQCDVANNHSPFCILSFVAHAVVREASHSQGGKARLKAAVQRWGRATAKGAERWAALPAIMYLGPHVLNECHLAALSASVISYVQGL